MLRNQLRWLKPPFDGQALWCRYSMCRQRLLHASSANPMAFSSHHAHHHSRTQISICATVALSGAIHSGIGRTPDSCLHWINTCRRCNDPPFLCNLGNAPHNATHVQRALVRNQCKGCIHLVDIRSASMTLNRICYKLAHPCCPCCLVDTSVTRLHIRRSRHSKSACTPALCHDIWHQMGSG